MPPNGHISFVMNLLSKFLHKVQMRKCDDFTNFERCFHYYFLLSVFWVRGISFNRIVLFSLCSAVISERIYARSQRWAEKVNVILSNLIRTEMEEAVSHAISVVKYSSHPSCSHQNVPFPVAVSPSITFVSLASTGACTMVTHSMLPAKIGTVATHL